MLLNSSSLNNSYSQLDHIYSNIVSLITRCANNSIDIYEQPVALVTNNTRPPFFPLTQEQLATKQESIAAFHEYGNYIDTLIAGDLTQFASKRIHKMNRNTISLPIKNIEENAQNLVERFNIHSSPSSKSFYLNKCTGIGTRVKLCSLDEFLAIVATLPKNKSAGIDKIPYELLTYACDELLITIYKFFEMCILCASIPHQWMEVIICLIYKNKGSPLDVNNHRPLSLFVVLRKIFGKCIKKSIHALINKQDNINFGYKAGQGIEDAIRCFEDHRITILENSSIVLQIHLDIQKAFDSLNRHFVLMALIEEFGDSTLVGLIYDFMQSRPRIRNLNKYSTVKETCNGIGQGDVLSPCIFTYGLGKAIQLLPNELLIALFADDSHVAISIKQSIERLFQELEIAFEPAGLALNRNKCVIVIKQKDKDKIVDAPEGIQITSGSRRLLGIMYGPNGIDYKAIPLARKSAVALNKHELNLIGYHFLNIKQKLQWFTCFIRPAIFFGCGLMDPSKHGCITPCKDICSLFRKELKIALNVQPWCPNIVALGIVNSITGLDYINYLFIKSEFKFKFMQLY